MIIKFRITRFFLCQPMPAPSILSTIHNDNVFIANPGTFSLVLKHNILPNKKTVSKRKAGPESNHQNNP